MRSTRRPRTLETQSGYSIHFLMIADLKLPELYLTLMGCLFEDMLLTTTFAIV
jgi:hypothetical protein